MHTELDIWKHFKNIWYSRIKMFKNADSGLERTARLTKKKLLGSVPLKQTRLFEIIEQDKAAEQRH